MLRGLARYPLGRPQTMDHHEGRSGSGESRDAMYNYIMQIRRIVMVLGVTMLLSACRIVPWHSVTPTPTPTVTSTATSTATRQLRKLPTDTLTPTPQYFPMCTPPLCAIGTSEVYYCSATCPNGCGTTCATYTPTP